MKKNILMYFSYTIALFIIIFWLIFLYFWTQPRACFDDKCFFVEIADDTESRKKWLMWVDKLKEDEWMLFVYQEPWKYWFWMKNMEIPLDIIWINEYKEVIHIEEDVQPCEEQQECKIHYPKEKANYVLEVKSWKVEKHDIELWNSVLVRY